MKVNELFIQALSPWFKYYWCETGEDLNYVIRHVLIHEIGHHFGLSDADMQHIEERG